MLVSKLSKLPLHSSKIVNKTTNNYLQKLLTVQFRGLVLCNRTDRETVSGSQIVHRRLQGDEHGKETGRDKKGKRRSAISPL